MRLFVRCESRLGICAEILEILVKHQIDLRGIEIENDSGVFLNFPKLEFGEFKYLMPEIRLIPGVFDVSLVPYMPHERDDQERLTLLTTLPEPIVSVDLKGDVVIANKAALSLLKTTEDDVRQKPLKNWVKGFNVNKWLSGDRPSAKSSYLQLRGRTYLADIYPIHIKTGHDDGLFAGGVITFKSPERLGRQISAYQKQTGEFEMMVAASQSMTRLIREAKNLSSLDAPLLITGETGTGKEVLAKACHQHSLRKDKPFLVLNCASIPDDAAESELFGYAAEVVDNSSVSKKGIIELAEGGTVFLDEIGDMSPVLQNKFLRLLQDGTYRRIGDEQEYHSNVRIISSTQKNLLPMCHQDEFRDDLYYRLNVLTLHIPPLRDRKADIIAIAECFVNRFVELDNKHVGMSPECEIALKTYHWPGNVRQLENTLLRAVSLVEGDVLEPEHLQLPNPTRQVGHIDDDFDGTLDEAMKSFESELLNRLYPAYPSSRQLGKKLGVSHTAIANKLREYQIGKHVAR